MCPRPGPELSPAAAPGSGGPSAEPCPREEHGARGRPSSLLQPRVLPVVRPQGLGPRNLERRVRRPWRPTGGRQAPGCGGAGAHEGGRLPHPASPGGPCVELFSWAAQAGLRRGLREGGGRRRAPRVSGGRSTSRRGSVCPGAGADSWRPPTPTCRCHPDAETGRALPGREAAGLPPSSDSGSAAA